MPRTLALLALAFAVVAAGCLGAKPTAPEKAAATVLPSKLAFAPSAAMKDASDAGEPNIIATPDGKSPSGSALYVTAPAGLVGKPNYWQTQAFLWRSDDDGATWKTIQKPDAAPANLPVFCSCDSDVEMSKSGTLYESDLWIAAVGFATNFVVTSSTDGGATWNPGNPLPAPTSCVDRQWLLPGEGSTIYLAYASFVSCASPVSVPRSGLWMSRSDDGGMTWTNFAPAAPIDKTFPLIGKPRLTADGTILFPYNRIDGTSNDPFNASSDIDVSISKDKGATWKEVKVATEPNGTGGLWSTQLAIGPDNKAAIVWMAQKDKNDRVVRVAFSDDEGAHWSAPATVTSETGNHVLPWIAARVDGTFAAAYYGTPTAGWNGDLPADTRWDAWVTIVDPAHPTNLTTVRASDEAVKMGSLCTSGSACSRDRELLDYVSLAVDKTGGLHLAYSQSTKKNEAVVHVASELLSR